MSHGHGATRIGSHPINHSNSEAEREYDRLRDEARREHSKMSSCFDRAHGAHESGDGSAAHDLSQEGHRHKENRDRLNKQASEYIFRENNAPGRVPPDTIDLHGQFVEEAEDILELRIRTATSEGQDHLHVIVGKGNHSPGHVQKIKPRVEQLCRELGLNYATEENEGRIYVNLKGGPAHMPSQQQWAPGYAHGGYGGGRPDYQSSYAHPSGGRPPPQYQMQQEQQQQQDELTGCLKLLKSCCIVM